MERRLGPFRRSMVEFRVIQRLDQHVFARDLGFVGPGFGFVAASGHGLHPPDLVFLRKDRLANETEWDGLSQAPPDLAIEILSPVDEEERVADEIAAYLVGGVPLLWVVDPRRRTIVVHAPEQRPVHLAEGGGLDGGDVLPGFRVAVADLFR